MRLAWHYRPARDSYASLRHYNHQLATVQRSQDGGWWWSAFNAELGVPLHVASDVLHSTIEDAKRGAEAYVRASLASTRVAG